MKGKTLLRRIRLQLALFMVALFLSGLTAIPIDAELTLILRFLPSGGELHAFIDRILGAYRSTAADHPFLLYGYDWLAFAHFILAILFWGPYRDPVRNIWVVQFGLIACALILPLAFIAGPARGIPFYWQLIDCSFGLFGAALLWPCYRNIRTLEGTPASHALNPA